MTVDRRLDELHEEDLDPHPIVQFQRWFDEAVAAGVPEPDAMCMASVSVGGTPSARMVLLKAVDHRGFVFYTNYDSEKSHQLAARPVAALVWRWYQVRRQVRVTGSVSRLDPAESDAYFATRERGSQLAAWASPQSRVLAGRADLDARMSAQATRFRGRVVPRPPWWGGIRVAPASVEFWQGRPDRLHDRLRYAQADRGWRIERLAP